MFYDLSWHVYKILLINLSLKLLHWISTILVAFILLLIQVNELKYLKLLGYFNNLNINEPYNNKYNFLFPIKPALYMYVHITKQLNNREKNRIRKKQPAIWRWVCILLKNLRG